jgi:hypothetical protein
LALLAFARAAGDSEASAIARKTSSRTFTPAVDARIDGPDIASCVASPKSRCGARWASMLAPP